MARPIYSQSNQTGEGRFGVWNIIRSHIDSVVSQGVQQSHFATSHGKKMMDSFKQRLEVYLQSSLTHVTLAPPGDRRFHPLHKEINGAVEGAVGAAMHEMNLTATNSSDTEDLIHSLDVSIESDLYREAINMSLQSTQREPDFFHSLSLADETVFVALVSMAVIVPIIFFSLLALFIFKRHKEMKRRRQEMLLREPLEFTMDEYSAEGKSRMENEAVPDLNLRHLRA